MGGGIGANPALLGLPVGERPFRFSTRFRRCRDQETVIEKAVESRPADARLFEQLRGHETSGLEDTGDPLTGGFHLAWTGDRTRRGECSLGAGRDSLDSKTRPASGGRWLSTKPGDHRAQVARGHERGLDALRLAPGCHVEHVTFAKELLSSGHADDG